MASTLEDSDHTSIKERIKPQFNLAQAVQQQIDLEALIHFAFPVKPLAQFEGAVTSEDQRGIFFH